jgi:ribose 5-phosphate isomerase B
MLIFLGSDHGGFELKEFLLEKLGEEHTVRDFGCDSGESCDYPDFAEKVARAVAGSNGKAIGILCCGTGIGMSIAANKVVGIRAAVVWDGFSARMAREHNNANVVCIGARAMKEEEALKLVETFLGSKFQGLNKEGERHKRRLEKIAALDSKQRFPLPIVSALVFNEKNEVFLMQSPKWQNKYGLPGGHVEVGEKMVEALRREVKEETGLGIYDEKLFKVVDAINPEGYYKKRHFIFHDYLAKARPGKVKLDGKEGTEFVWIQPALALKELDMDPFTRKALEDWVKIMALGATG